MRKFVVVIVFCCATPSWATLLLYDGFEYTSGDPLSGKVNPGQWARLVAGGRRDDGYHQNRQQRPHAANGAAGQRPRRQHHRQGRHGLQRRC